MLLNIYDLYKLPLWLQVYFQTEKDPKVRCLFRKTTKIFNSKILLIIEDIEYCKYRKRIGWYHTNKDFMLIADDTKRGIEEYEYYNKMYESSLIFLNNI
tara:strand:+ start:405 stop:701 length:297 start_codon:yes stop_codon:yes gene_type:complete